jgi:hypothetical protein
VLGWCVELHDDHFGETTADAVIFQTLRERGWVYVTQDRKIRSRGAERQALIDNRLRTFSIAATANLPAAATIEVLVRAEADMQAVLTDVAAPFLIAINKDSSLHRLALG